VRDSIDDGEAERVEAPLRVAEVVALLEREEDEETDIVVLAVVDLDRVADAVAVRDVVVVLETVVEPVAVLLLVDVRDPTALDVELFDDDAVRVEVSVFTGDADGNADIDAGNDAIAEVVDRADRVDVRVLVAV
jgi:hypothetical protein